MIIQNKLLSLLGMVLLTLIIGCADSSFSGNFSQKNSAEKFDDDDDGSKGKPPVAIAYGGFLQFDYYDLSKSDENVMGVESLIGQPIMAKVHQKNGVRVDIGYPGLQSSFVVE